MKRRVQALARLVWALVLGLALPATLAAQGVTTSAVGGRVTNAEGQGVPSVQITATNNATGAVSTVGTRSDGRYFIPGLQPGNYRVQVNGLGFGSQVRERVDLALGQTATVDFSLATEALALEGLTVVGEGTGVISRSRTGASAVVSDSTLRRTPTITRDLQDFTRLVPQLAVTNSTTGAVSAGGRNNRFNQLQIDGTASNDLFGLSASGSPSGQAGAKAITLEAIQELQVVLAPFDVRQNGFTGASVNAVTRSGTNRWQGSISGFLRNQDLVGSYPGAPAFDKFVNREVAGSFGGPIARDRAFFFAAGEISNRVQPTNVIAGTDATLGVTQAQAQELTTYLQGLGYDAGGGGARDLERESLNLFGRLDFNLGQNNRLTIRHNYIDGVRQDFGRSERSYQLNNGGYSQNSTTNSSVVQLNSSFGSGLFNELRIGYNRVRDFRSYDGGVFPRITVRSPNGNLIAGTENFSGQNVLDQDALEVTNDLSIPWNAHTFTAGVNTEFGRFSNLFVRNPFGNYEFADMAALRAGTPQRYEYSYLCRVGLPNCVANGEERADFGVNRFGLYVQDRWDATDNLQLTFGVRGDLTTLPDDVAENPSVLAAYSRSTSDIPGTTVLFNPRLGFNWDVTGNGATQVRGGVGTFSGRAPYVWISNAYGNTGLDYVRFTCTSAATSPRFVADPNNQPTGCVGATTAAPNEINLIDPDFKLPQVARYSLGIDRQIPFGLVATVEGLYTQTINDILYRNVRVQPDAQGRTVEGRPRYQTRSVAGLGDIIEITNTDEGYAYNLTGQIQRPFRNGWDFSLAYTYSRSEDVNPLTSSQAISNWRFNLTGDDPNNPGLRRSDFDIPHRFIATGSYRLDLIRRASTDLSLVYVGQSGQPFSVRYNDDVNFDGSFGNDLLYVPRDASEIRFEPFRAPGTNSRTDQGQAITPAQSWANFNDFIERVDCLNAARGSVLVRNSCRAPWSNRFDFRVAQNLSAIRGQNAQITLDILNVGNLINEDWGRSQFISNQVITVLPLATATGLNNQPDASGRRLYQAFAPRKDIFTTSNLDSRYQIQLGLRYTF
jgi:hypothetical protein